MNIDKLLLKLFKRSNSLEELEILESWKKESDENISFIKLMNTDTKSMDYKTFDRDTAWQKLNKKIEGNTSTIPKLLLVVILAAVALFATYKYIGQEKALPSFDSLEGIQHFALQDNSEIWLNKRSHFVQLNDFSDQRRVSLKGEAFFEVTANADNPFIIEINDEDYIRVIGTSFNLTNDGENFDLIVYSGKVELHTLDRSITLLKNDRITKTKGAYVKLKNKEHNAASWKTGVLYFDETPLSKVFKDLESHFNCSFIYDGIDLSNCSLRSRFQNETLESVLQEFEQLFDIKYSKVENKVVIEEVTCP